MGRSGGCRPDLRRAFVAAALAVVEHEGVSAFSLRALARQLGVSHAAPAAHFLNKAGLLDEIAQKGFERLGRALAAAAAAAPADNARLAAACSAYIAFARAHPAMFCAMFGRVAESSPAVGEARARVYSVLLRAVEVGLAHLPPRQRPSADLLVFVAWSAFHGAAMLWVESPIRRSARGSQAWARFEEALAFLIRRVAGSPQSRLSCRSGL